MDAAISRLKNAGIPTLNFSGTEDDELTVFPWMPAAAIYFRDPDGHLLEFIAPLPGIPDPQVPVTTWSAWNQHKQA